MNAPRELRGMVLGILLAASALIPLMCSHDDALVRTIGLQRDSIEASRDTTRRLVLAVGVLADGAQALQRRAVQAELARDRLDVALAQVRKVNGNLTLTVDDLKSLAETAERVTAAADSVKFQWRVRQTPYTAVVAATVPRTLTGALLDIEVRADPAPLAFRLGCGAPKKENLGIRDASLTVTAPKWLHVSIDDVETDPEVCNAAAAKAKSWWRDRRTWMLAGLTVFGFAR